MAGLLSIAQSMNSTLNANRAGFNIITLDEKDTPIASHSLQYFPESIRDTKATMYSQKEVLGGSLPIYQWSAGGARSISLTAILSCDVNTGGEAGDSTTNPAVGFSLLSYSGLHRHNPDIRSMIVWLRQHLYPRYAKAGGPGATTAPRKVFLHIPHSGIGNAGMGGNSAPGTGSGNSVLAFMTQCEIDYKAFFPNGLPRLVNVSMTFEETCQYKGSVVFPSPSESLDALYSQTTVAGSPSDYLAVNGFNKGNA